MIAGVLSRAVILRVAAVVVAAGLAGCGGGPTYQATLDPSASLDQLLNDHRAKRGLNRLTSDSRLRQAAAEHARDLASRNRLGHNGGDGTDQIARARRVGYGPFVAENVAAGQKSPAEVMQAWLSSSGHRANIELSPATHYGFARASAPGTQYGSFWVLVIGREPSDPNLPVRTATSFPSLGGSWWPF